MTIRKLKIYREEAKDRFTSHWDWDCISTAELDAIAGDPANRSNEESAPYLRLLRRLQFFLGLKNR